MRWHRTGGCVCGPSESSVAIGNSMSFYIARNIHTGEINQVISWLQGISRDCLIKISELESLKRSRESSEKHRSKMNRLARQFYDREYINMDIETQQKIIQQRLGCDWPVALKLAEQVSAWAVRQRRKDRNQEVLTLARAGMSKQELAKKYGISRQQIHNIIKNKQGNLFLK